MRFILPLAVALGAAGLLASCGTGGDAEAGADPAPQEGFEMKSGELFNDDSQKIIDRFGATNPNFDKSGQRKGAAENSMVSRHFDKGYAANAYQGNLDRYEKRSFWGRKDYTGKVYDGATDGDRFLQSAREGSKGASEGSRVSRENSKVLNPGSVDRSAARESGRAPLARPSDAETDFRRRVYQEPEVKDWRAQRALDVEDTRAMLGR
jgi:hypothetical protein